MEFRAPSVASQLNERHREYLTKRIDDHDAANSAFQRIIEELGSAVESYPDWHPIVRAPRVYEGIGASPHSDPRTYDGCDHTRNFVRGFVTCPYSSERADELVVAVNRVPGLQAYRLNTPLYADDAFPVVVEAHDVVLEADGTIRSRDALKWFVQLTAEQAESAKVAETWWNIRSRILGSPHGSRSSLFVNQHAGGHARKILEVMNASGMFGEIIEDSLDMISAKKRKAIAENLLRSAISTWDGDSEEHLFELRDESCKAKIRDTWQDGFELSLSVAIGNHDLFVSGFYYRDGDRIEFLEPRGKRFLAEKFI